MQKRTLIAITLVILLIALSAASVMAKAPALPKGTTITETDLDVFSARRADPSYANPTIGMAGKKEGFNVAGLSFGNPTFGSPVRETDLDVFSAERGTPSYANPTIGMTGKKEGFNVAGLSFGNPDAFSAPVREGFNVAGLSIGNPDAFSAPVRETDLDVFSGMSIGETDLDVFSGTDADGQ